MNKFFTILICIIIVISIMNYNNENANFSLEEYILDVSTNFQNLPQPPTEKTFESLQDIQSDNDVSWLRSIGLFLSHNFSTLWSYIIYPFKVLWFIVSNIDVFFRRLIIWE